MERQPMNKRQRAAAMLARLQRGPRFPDGTYSAAEASKLARDWLAMFVIPDACDLVPDLVPAKAKPARPARAARAARAARKPASTLARVTATAPLAGQD